MPAATTNLYNYPVNPSPQGGSGAFGSVPGAIALPNPSAALGSVYPNLSGTNTALSGDIFSKLSGQLSPATLQQLQSASATFGTANGMPGSNATPGTLANNFNLESLGLNTENQINQGIQDYNATIPTVSGTQTVSPALEANIAEENAVNAAAPNPAAAESYAESLYNNYLNTFKNQKGAGYLTSTGQKPAATPTTTVTPSIYSPLTSTSPSGSYYDGVWYPTGMGPTGALPLTTGNMFGNASPEIDPETGLPVGGLNDIPMNLDTSSGE